MIQPRIAEHAGQLFKTTGDGFLVEFSSAVEALNCAADIQRDMALHEDDAPEDRQIAYRIGINVGEIIADDGDVFGDGVNIAARLEVEADPGGILVSETVFRTVRGKLDLGFEDIGPQTVKNIADPVQAYHVLLDPEDAGQVFTAQPRRRLPWLIGAVGVLIAALLAVFLFLPTNEEVAEDPVPPEPVALRLLVLPYMAQDPDGEVYADATSENLWLTLSRLRDLETVTRSDALTLENSIRHQSRSPRSARSAGAGRAGGGAERTDHADQQVTGCGWRCSLGTNGYDTGGGSAGRGRPALDGHDLRAQNTAQRHRTRTTGTDLYRQPAGVSGFRPGDQPAADLSLEHLSIGADPVRTGAGRPAGICGGAGRLCADQL